MCRSNTALAVYGSDWTAQISTTCASVDAAMAPTLPNRAAAHPAGRNSR